MRRAALVACPPLARVTRPDDFALDDTPHAHIAGATIAAWTQVCDIHGQPVPTSTETSRRYHVWQSEERMILLQKT